MLTKQELRQLQNSELLEELSKSTKELMKIRLEKATGTLKETHKLSALKKYIAQIKTIQKESGK